jgi:DNA topoisomerase-1
LLNGNFKTQNGAELVLTCDVKIKTEEEAKRILEIAKQNKLWKIISVSQTETKRSPRPPFITSTLEQAASSRFGFSPSRTMVLAQRLYEAGYITYMRTDSFYINHDALNQIYGEIERSFGKEYLYPRSYQTKSKTAQEAHEAIRPTDISQKQRGANNDQKKIYQLIRERTLASQMADAKILRTKISANIGAEEQIPNFSASGSVVVFAGWLEADKAARQEDVEIPPLKEGDRLELIRIEVLPKETTPPPRYTEAGLIKELEKREIGRPSTYATIIKTLLDREYVVKENRTLRPTDTGEIVSNFLEQNFAHYISDSFTAEMEQELDEIAAGKREYAKSLKDFYEPFSKEVKAKEHIEKITNLGDADEKFRCPICGGQMIVKLGRGGKFLSCKKFPDCAGALKIDGSVVESPKETGELCPVCGGKLIERTGRYGKFIACTNYPKCKYVQKSLSEENQAKTGIRCPKCGVGEIVSRRGRFGIFYSCSKYPDCQYAMKAKPTGNICKLCGALMMEGTKTIPERCSNKDCPNYNPLKTNS